MPESLVGLWDSDLSLDAILVLDIDQDGDDRAENSRSMRLARLSGCWATDAADGIGIVALGVVTKLGSDDRLMELSVLIVDWSPRYLLCLWAKGGSGPERRGSDVGPPVFVATALGKGVDFSFGVFPQDAMG
jgi:hypothetical protein